MRAPLMLDGRTAVLGLLGDPVAQVKAPQPLSELLQSRGINAVLVPMQVVAADLPHVLEAFAHIRNFAGFIVTVPHKQAVAALVDGASAAASAADAVNVVRRMHGRWLADLLDGVGFVDNLRAHGVEPRGLEVAVAGAGGAGNAIALALGAAGAARLCVYDVDAVRQQALLARLARAGVRAEPWDGHSPAPLLVNATPVGMRAGDPLPMNLEAITPGAVVADVIMAPEVTPLLEAAVARGARIVTGRGMMDCQLQRMADFFQDAIPT